MQAKNSVFKTRVLQLAFAKLSTYQHWDGLYTSVLKSPVENEKKNKVHFFCGIAKTNSSIDQT